MAIQATLFLCSAFVFTPRLCQDALFYDGLCVRRPCASAGGTTSCAKTQSQTGKSC